MPLILGTNSIKDTGYNVDNSLRFNSGSSDSLTRSTTAGNRTTWTFSTWFKRSKLGVLQSILEHDDTNYFRVRITSGDVFEVFDSNTNKLWSWLPLLRDTSAWYHIVIRGDSTDGTNGNRLRLYVNGSLAPTNAVASIDQNYTFSFNQGGTLQIGKRGSTDYLDGYLAETILIDGSALAPDQFGEFDSDSGIWKPINVSGLTFGNQGFYLEFKESGTGTNASGMGADTSGNTNHFAVNNLTAIDQTTDTCTNNFATFNPLGKANLTYAEGNTKITNASGAHNGSLSTLAVNKGKWYYEVKFIDGSQTRSMAGICKVTDNLDNEYVGDTANSYGYFRSNGNKFNNSSSSSYGSTPSNNDIISVAFDADNGTLWFGLNGTWQNSATKSEIEAGTTTNSAFSSITMDDFFAFACSGEDATCQANFGSPSYAISSGNTDGNGYGNFEYEVPSGYYALCTKNLAEYG
jgi:hypothetical protein